MTGYEQKFSLALFHVEVGTPVLVVEQARRAAVVALHDVQRQAVDMDAWAAGHGAQA
jgi:hypothetical protein